MTINDGAGVSERQEDWTVESIFEDWIADKKLSRRKIAWLETDLEDFFCQMDRDFAEPYSPTVAPSWMTSELDHPEIVYKVQCMADLLDFLKPKRAGISRLEKIDTFLRRKGFLEIEQ